MIPSTVAAILKNITSQVPHLKYQLYELFCMRNYLTKAVPFNIFQVHVYCVYIVVTRMKLVEEISRKAWAAYPVRSPRRSAASVPLPAAEVTRQRLLAALPSATAASLCSIWPSSMTPKKGKFLGTWRGSTNLRYVCLRECRATYSVNTTSGAFTHDEI